ncbi:Tripartite tricarboxylate transporter TctB family protein [Actinobaculum suis]|uniref:Tripartite tricarboxylate transporter TctB family protein n=1 Tax=Actinobaculum suis TaxID=1657 RepID=A0A0K9EUU2_9ACTO|nr:tripartite tricarboxylate transporter TctB family protein [Actinobaculum suis]KMY23913.1 hypothetical protein ACU19_01460 [Actinobaculum suis]MDY5152842.1 tripartite tricarboxylate transporter TctB family protein [Actinobaculum suis]OCA93348.1 hypothetical protein ACU21_00960 [Actinobaculum suis]SDE65593.1 Tripartite tricarboxylate transporter TctB family protein [Actinobaculum suis]
MNKNKATRAEADSARKVSIPDLVISLIAIAGGIGIIIYGFGMRRLSTGHLGPGLFPIVGGILFIVFGAILAIESLRGTVESESEELDEILEAHAAAGEDEEKIGAGGSFEFTDESKSRLVVNGLVVIGGVLGYILLAEHLGFILTMFLMILAIMLALKEKPIRAVVFSAVVTAVLFLAFEKGLLVQLPDGILGI